GQPGSAPAPAAAPEPTPAPAAAPAPAAEPAPAAAPAPAASNAQATDVRMPELGESVTEGTITQWLKSVGDTVEVDDALL
ncbi:biotin/lipoyl-containing protein, partial [Corynebacterium felinum]